MLNICYLTIVKKSITMGQQYGRVDLTKATQNKLFSIQRMFLLEITLGYSTISNDSLNILKGILPIFLKSNLTLLKVLSIIGKMISLNNVFPSYEFNVRFQVGRLTLLMKLPTFRLILTLNLTIPLIK